MKCLLVLATISLVSFNVSAKPAYNAKFKATYPEAKTLQNCKVCHIGSGYKERNDFAKDYAANAYDFKAIEGFDSDVDGFTNLIEINAGTFPGDKDSHPALPVPPTEEPVPPTLPVPPTEEPVPPTLPVPPTEEPVPPTLPVPPIEEPIPPTQPVLTIIPTL
jgi:hypothetical protein